jgi:hypothetical protein
MKRNLQLLSVLMLSGSLAFAQGQGRKQVDLTQLQKVSFVNELDANPITPAMGGGPCITAADTWTDLNGAGGAPCSDSTGNCVVTDPAWATIGIYGSEAYLLDGVEMGFDYVFNMCSGFGAGAWIPEITILAPDGTTIDANNAASSASGATHADQCTLEWTATQSGEYSIIVNEMGTSVGDAPNQADCATSYPVDNGNPTVECGTNPASCAPAGPCVAGVLSTTGFPMDVCPGDVFTLTTDGSEQGDGGFGVFFSPGANASGGTGAAVTLTGVTFPADLDDDLGGVLSSNNLDPFLGSWVMYQVSLDGDGNNCAASADSVTVTFLPASDPNCGGSTGIQEELNLGLEVYPNPSNGSFVVEMDGDNSMTTIKVMDMTGREIYNQTSVVGISYKSVLDLNVVQGTYLMSVITNNFVVTKRLQVK